MCIRDRTYNAAYALLHDEVFYNRPSMNARIYELMDGDLDGFIFAYLKAASRGELQDT